MVNRVKNFKASPANRHKKYNDDKSWLKTFTQWLSKNKWTIAIVGAVAILAPLLIMALFNKPIADDFAFFSEAQSDNPIVTAARFYLDENGRAGHGFFTATLYGLFGERAVVVGAIVLLIGLALSLIWLARTILVKILDDKTPWPKVIALGLWSTAVVILSSRSLYDSYLWLTSSTVYITGIIGSVIIAILAINLFLSNRLRWWHLVGFGVVIIINSYFNEITDVYLVGTFIFALIVYGLVKKFNICELKTKKRKNTSVLVVGLIVSTVAFLMLYLSPGSNERRSLMNSSFDIYAMFIQPLSQMVDFKYLLSPQIALSVGVLALLVTGILPKTSAKQVAFSMIAGLVYLLAIVYVFCVINGYAQDGYIALRSYIIPASVVGVVGSIMISIIVSKLIGNTMVLNILITLLIMAIIPVTYMYYKPIIQAVVIRHDAFVTRANSIRRQVSSDNGVVEVEALPVLLVDTEAQDLGFNGIQEDWVTKAFKRYYDMSESTKLVYLPQDNHYCTNDATETPYYFGAKPCFDISDN